MAKAITKKAIGDGKRNKKFQSEGIVSLEQRIHEFDQLLARGASNEAVREFDEGTELVLSDVFGNPSEILEAYAYAQLGEAAGWINLPEEGQLEGEQDVERQSLHQRKAVLQQALAGLKANPRQKNR
jgi:hypothetical protein